MARFKVTYAIVTPESAENGDVAENGFALPGGWRFSLDVVLADKDADYTMTLREAIDITGNVEDGGRAFYSIDSDPDYRTGEDTSYSIHPPANITRSSYRRLARLLTGR